MTLASNLISKMSSTAWRKPSSSAKVVDSVANNMSANRWNESNFLRITHTNLSLLAKTSSGFNCFLHSLFIVFLTLVNIWANYPNSIDLVFPRSSSLNRSELGLIPDLQNFQRLWFFFSCLTKNILALRPSLSCNTQTIGRAEHLYMFRATSIW